MSRSSKADFLRAARAWNDRARLVESPEFAQSDFFDPRDKVQVKYEMLRSHAVDGLPVTKASRQHGYSRESFYAAEEAFRTSGVPGLIDERRGPKEPYKLKPAAQAFLRREIAKKPSSSSAELADLLRERLNVVVHRRSIERFRSAQEKKKRLVSKTRQRKAR